MCADWLAVWLAVVHFWGEGCVQASCARSAQGGCLVLGAWWLGGLVVGPVAVGCGYRLGPPLVSTVDNLRVARLGLTVLTYKRRESTDSLRTSHPD
jgi:hypothetical protein